ncbi:CDK-activating kinase assembly factor MAT1-domain-containing protein [Geopyxis carbonaria]|nr:CDK-activating kinase assembly factor MAT1-domain-containing protein [Geopyxis carbonaria]
MAPPSPTSSNDRCPICKSLRFFTQNLTMLIEPTCYHSMCASCVDRLFGGGPATCPYAGCTARLRANRFRQQTFGDIAVEREVDVRKRVHKVFNKRPSEFPSDREWDDYLETVEELVFALMSANKTEKLAAEDRLKAYEESNRPTISKNAERAAAEAAAFFAREEAAREERRQLRDAEVRALADERADAEDGRRRQLEAMARGDMDAVERIKAEVAARAAARREAAEREASRVRTLRVGRELVLADLMTGEGGEEEEEEGVWEPLGRGVVEENGLFGMLETGRYGKNAWIDDFVARADVSAGGYARDEWYERVVGEVFGGLTVFVGEEEAPMVAASPVLVEEL